jgi:hypothetical protein
VTTHDPFTLNLFGDIALSSDFGSGFGLGFTGLSGETVNDDGDPDPTTPVPAATSSPAARPVERTTRERGENFISLMIAVLRRAGRNVHATISPQSGSRRRSSARGVPPRPTSRRG